MKTLDSSAKNRIEKVKSTSKIAIFLLFSSGINFDEPLIFLILARTSFGKPGIFLILVRT